MLTYLCLSWLDVCFYVRTFSTYFWLAFGAVFIITHDTTNTNNFKLVAHQIQEKQPHALLIAGDIFDVINPGSQAQNNSTNF